MSSLVRLSGSFMGFFSIHVPPPPHILCSPRSGHLRVSLPPPTLLDHFLWDHSWSSFRLSKFQFWPHTPECPRGFLGCPTSWPQARPGAGRPSAPHSSTGWIDSTLLLLFSPKVPRSSFGQCLWATAERSEALGCADDLGCAASDSICFPRTS